MLRSDEIELRKIVMNFVTSNEQYDATKRNHLDAALEALEDASEKFGLHKVDSLRRAAGRARAHTEQAAKVRHRYELLRLVNQADTRRCKRRSQWPTTRLNHRDERYC